MTIPTNQQPQAAELGMRIRVLRESLKWSQSRLADAAGLGSAQTVSTIEGGTRELKALELVRIANALHTTADALLRGEIVLETVEWRECSDDLDKEIEAVFLERCRRFKQIEDWVGYQPSKELSLLTLGNIRSPSFEDMQKAAHAMAREMQLGGRPACSLQKTLEEDYGVKVFFEGLGLNGSACSAKGPFGYAVLLSSSEPPWRRNFSLAHELFHLLFDNSTSNIPKKRLERLADVFASALLLPTDALTEAVARKTIDGKIAHVDLIEIAREFAVSTEAMLWRLVNLKRVAEPTVDELLANTRFRELDRASLKQGEPPQTLPERYTRFCLTLFRSGKLSMTRLSEFLETSLVDLAEEIANANIEAEEGAEAQLTVG
jgi:Zn-dependent peptidase ImmA (M78 family)/DNA-binding XRE family transcriptional regulator